MLYTAGSVWRQMDIQPMVVDKKKQREMVETYLRTFDAEEVGRLSLGEKGKDVDSAIARICGIEILKSKKMNEMIRKEIVAKKLEPDELKCDAYILSREDPDGRVKVKALEVLGKWTKLEEPSINNFTTNMSWFQIMEVAHNKKRIKEMGECEREVTTLKNPEEK